MRGETAVGIGERKSARVRRHPHLAAPIERTQRVGGSWMNVARRAGFLVGDLKRQRRGNRSGPEVVPRSTGDLKLINWFSSPQRPVLDHRSRRVTAFILTEVRH